jgi:hypothetical protein
VPHARPSTLAANACGRQRLTAWPEMLKMPTRRTRAFIIVVQSHRQDAVLAPARGKAQDTQLSCPRDTLHAQLPVTVCATREAKHRPHALGQGCGRRGHVLVAAPRSRNAPILCAPKFLKRRGHGELVVSLRVRFRGQVLRDTRGEALGCNLRSDWRHPAWRPTARFTDVRNSFFEARADDEAGVHAHSLQNDTA